MGEADKIWTISLNSESPKTPLVLLHGMGAGVAFWVLNLDSLAVHRPVYAFDMLGNCVERLVNVERCVSSFLRSYIDQLLNKHTLQSRQCFV